MNPKTIPTFTTQEGSSLRPEQVLLPKSEIVEGRYDDSVELQMEYTTVTQEFKLSLILFIEDDSNVISFDENQVDNLIQKLLDIRRQWPRKEDK